MRTFTRCALGAAAVSALYLVGTTARAQVDTGTILGTVKDASGAVVAGASVTITHEGQAFTLSRVTRPDGTYIFTPIRIGTYRVEVESPGFKKAVRRGIELNLQQQAVVDINLETGQLTEAVEVTAEVPLLQTQSGEVGQTITGATIKDLPLNGRDYTMLARLSAGTARPQQGARAPLQFTANGTRPGQNNYMLDGIDNNTSNVDFLGGTAYVVKPPVDAIAEIKVLTSSFGAEYGRAGGAVLSATLKSGSNAFHGSAWEFNRNDAPGIIRADRSANGPGGHGQRLRPRPVPREHHPRQPARSQCRQADEPLPGREPGRAHQQLRHQPPEPRDHPHVRRARRPRIQRQRPRLCALQLRRYDATQARALRGARRRRGLCPG